MSIYVLSQSRIEELVNNARRNRDRFSFAAAVLLGTVILLWYFRPGLPIFHEPLRVWLIGIAGSLVPPLLRNVWNSSEFPRTLHERLGKTKLEITGSLIRISNGWTEREVSRSELLRAEEPSLGRGLYLRTSNRYRSFVVSQTLDGYEAAKSELRGMGLPVEKTFIPPNWEEFVFVLLFVGTSVCAFSVRNIKVLELNLFVSCLVSIAGFLVIGANPDNKKDTRMRGGGFGALLPVVFAGLGLLLALWG